MWTAAFSRQNEYMPKKKKKVLNYWCQFLPVGDHTSAAPGHGDIFTDAH